MLGSISSLSPPAWLQPEAGEEQKMTLGDHSPYWLWGTVSQNQGYHQHPTGCSGGTWYCSIRALNISQKTEFFPS